MPRRPLKRKMGNYSSARVHPEPVFPKRETGPLLQVDDDNGYILSDVCVNDDVLIEIMCHLPPQNILQCRKVCKNWCNLIDSEVWKSKLLMSPYKDINALRSLPWHFVYLILQKNVLRRNFIKNPNGEDGLKSWEVTSNGGDRFRVESPPCGTEGVSPYPSCFATSYHACNKEQIINLSKEGAVGAFMDEVRPAITVTEWYAGRFDCAAVYDITVELLGSRFETIAVFKTRNRCGGDFGPSWQKMNHTFVDYENGVRYIRYCHGGVDERFWAGHYGSKFCGGSVVLDVCDVDSSKVLSLTEGE